MIVSKEDAVGSIQGAVSKERMQLGRLQRGCQRHQTKVASHTAVPMGTANQRSLFAKRGKVNGWYGIALNNIACPWVGDMSGSCPLPKGKVPVVWCRFPAISKHLKAFLYGWLPLSNAYGISSVVSQSSNLTAEYAPDGGNEPPAQGNTLG